MNLLYRKSAWRWGTGPVRYANAMPLTVTRRQLAIGLAANTALLAQAPPAPLPATADEELKAVTEQFQGNSERLGKFDIPMATEPAFTFKP